MKLPERPLFFDLETKNATLDINKHPLRAYAEGCKLDRVAWALGDEPVQVSTDVGGLVRALMDADALVAHNIAFDLSVLEYTVDDKQLHEWVSQEVLHRTGWIPPLCTMGMARLLGLPGALGNLVRYLNVGEKQDYDFTQAQREATDLFESPERRAEREARLTAYAKNDVEVMRAAYKVMVKALAKYPGALDSLAVHQRINSRGVGLDRDALETKIVPLEQASEDARREFTKLTGFVPTKVHSFLTWLKRNGHGNLTSVRQDALEDVLESTKSREVKRAIELRQQFTDGDEAKLAKLRHWCDRDGRIRQAFVYAGATTGRWSSTKAQLQNLKRDGEARKCMVARDGYKLWCADYHGVELRASLWLSGHQDALQDMHDGGDPYMRIAKGLYGGSATKQHRYQCKQALLASQFGAGVGRIQSVLKVGENVAVELRDGIHATYPGYRILWDELTQAVHLAFSRPKERHEVADGKASFERLGGTLLLHLPTGRSMAYRGAKLCDGDDGLFEYTRRWDKTFTPQRKVVRNGGFVLENLASAMCRDLLAGALVRLEAVPDVSVVGHVHDSVFIEVPERLVTDATARRLLDLFVPNADQLPKGMLVGAEWHWGDSWSE